MTSHLKSIAVIFFFFFLLLCWSGKEALALDSGAIFIPGPDMTSARCNHWNAVLPDGRVILFGGEAEGSSGALNTADIYDPRTNTFTSRSMKATREFGAVARLADGRYLLVGGLISGTDYRTSAEIFDPTTNNFVTTAGSMTYGRVDVNAATLKSGKVLVLGPESVSVGELFNPDDGTFILTDALNTSRDSPLIVPTDDGKSLVLGGQVRKTGTMLERVELYDPGTNDFTIVRETLFNGESGWGTLSPTAWGSNPVSHQSLKDGRYLFIAVRSTGASAYEATLFTVDPVTKQIAKFPITPSLPIYPQASGVNSPQVLVDQRRDRAYFLNTVTFSQIRLYTIFLNNGNRNDPPDTYMLPSDYYLFRAGYVVLQDGRLFLTGGSSSSTRDFAIAQTMFAKPLVGFDSSIYLLLLD